MPLQQVDYVCVGDRLRYTDRGDRGFRDFFPGLCRSVFVVDARGERFLLERRCRMSTHGLRWLSCALFSWVGVARGSKSEKFSACKTIQ